MNTILTWLLKPINALRNRSQFWNDFCFEIARFFLCTWYGQILLLFTVVGAIMFGISFSITH